VLLLAQGFPTILLVVSCALSWPSCSNRNQPTPSENVSRPLGTRWQMSSHRCDL